jgi:hypothetical protein
MTGADHGTYPYVLEEEEVFAKFQNSKPTGPSLSTKFIRFAEAYFTNEKHDPQHRPSVNSCLLRVPGSHNSKNGQQVSVIQQWGWKETCHLVYVKKLQKVSDPRET